MLTQYNARSLNEHLSSSKWWDFGRKQGGLYIFTPTITAANSSWSVSYTHLDVYKRQAEAVLKEAEKLGAAPNPVGAESKYEMVPMFYRVSGTFRKADPDVYKRQLWGQR